MKNNYWDENYANIIAALEQWQQQCRDLPEYQQLDPAHKDNFGFITHFFTEKMYVHHLQEPSNWTARALEDLLRNVLPQHQLLLPEGFLDAMEPTLSVLIHHLHNIGEINQRKAQALITRLRRIAPKLDRAINPSPVDTLGEELIETETSVKEAPPYVAPSLEQWRELYRLAGLIKELQPWEALWDDDLVTIKLPGREELVYCSALGKNDNGFYGVAVYPDNESALGHWHVVEAPEEDTSFVVTLSYQNCLICKFGDREDVSSVDREIMRDLGLKFRGRGQWIYFRVLQTGYYPWYLNQEQADFLIQILQHFTDAYRALAEGQVSVDFDAGETLQRSYQLKQEKWIDRAVPAEPIMVPKQVWLIQDELLIANLKRQKKNFLDIEIDIMYLPMPIQERNNEIPYFPKLLLLVDSREGMVILQDLFGPNVDNGDKIISMIRHYILEYGKPKAIRLRDYRLEGYLTDLCEKTDIKLIVGQGVPVIDEIFEDIFGFDDEYYDDF